MINETTSGNSVGKRAKHGQKYKYSFDKKK